MPMTPDFAYGAAGLLALIFGGYVLRACFRGDIKNELYNVLDIIVGLALLVGGCFLIGKTMFCIQSSYREDDVTRSQHAAIGEYTCAMHPAIRQPDPGACPVCTLTLARVDAQGNVQMPPQQGTRLKFYTCPSHAKVIIPTDGQCPICDKILVPYKPMNNAATNSSEEEPTVPSEYEGYLCSMHPRKTIEKPGKCAKCGMDLVPARKKAEAD